MEGKYLPYINCPDDVKRIDEKELSVLADEVRRELITTVSKNGGHLASNLGVVELTIALHRVFSSPEDKIVWDVSHQCYTHKLFTGRGAKFDTLRKPGGISGFTRRNESEHDVMSGGHSSVALSAAYGIAAANKITIDEVNVGFKYFVKGLSEGRYILSLPLWVTVLLRAVWFTKPLTMQAEQARAQGL